MRVEPATIARLAAPAAGLGLGALAITAGAGFRSGWVWVPDLLAGGAFFALAGLAWSRHRRLAIIAAATGLLWCAGSIWDVAVFWHRGPLVQLLLTYPGGRASDRTTRSAVLGGYVVASVPSLWGTDAVATALAAVVVVLATMRWQRTNGRARAAAGRALIVTLLFAVVVVGGVAARAVAGPVRTALPVLVLYDLAIIAGMTVLGAALVVRARTGMTDVVVDLAERRSEAARAALARAVGDPTLRVGYSAPGSDRYVDEFGAIVSLPQAGGDRHRTIIATHDGATIALFHEAGALDDPQLRDAVTRAAQLGAANARLQARVRADVDAAEASRQRLLTASDDERRRLGDEIETAMRRRLRELIRGIEEAIAAEDAPALQRARARIEDVGHGIDRAIVGLQPPDLESGLARAVHALASRSAVGVTVTGAPRRRPRVVEAAAYYVCAEAITNTAKHAPGARVRIDLTDADDALLVIVQDDGEGGADPGAGTGLTGVADRVAALGGSFDLRSPRGSGTTITAMFPDAG